jgi:predicted dinucleotide-binding enzyme
MRIAILGSGNVGKALASSFTRAGHRVTLTASKPDNARTAASQTGAQAADSNQQAIADAEVVVLALQYQTVDADTTNRVNPADPGSVLDGSSAAE